MRRNDEGWVQTRSSEICGNMCLELVTSENKELGLTHASSAKGYRYISFPELLEKVYHGGEEIE